MISQETYPLWHGGHQMKKLLHEILAEDNFMVEGHGIRVKDKGGRWYLDARSGLWNVTLGYNHPKITRAIEDQLRRLPFATLLSYGRPPAVTVEFARALAGRLPAELGHLRLGNSGSQMTEAAVLLSRFFRHACGESERTAVIAFEGSYHGLGPGATTLSGCLREAHDWCGSRLGDVHHVSPRGNWTEAVTNQVSMLGAGRVTAVIFEPMMGTAGIIPAPEDLGALSAFCAATGIHLIADEVSTGYGRVGHLSRMLQLDIIPDLLVLSKGITAGYVPGAALAVHSTIFDQLFDVPSGEIFLHGTTADGHPLGAAVGLAVLGVLYEDGVMASVESKGERLRRNLRDVQEEHVPDGGVAGVGLMQRLSLVQPGGEPWPVTDIRGLHAACEEAGLITSIGSQCLMFAPPLVTTEDECQEIAERLDSGFRRFGKQRPGVDIAP